MGDTRVGVHYRTFLRKPFEMWQERETWSTFHCSPHTKGESHSQDRIRSEQGGKPYQALHAEQGGEHL